MDTYVRRILEIASAYVASLSRDTDAAIRLPINPRRGDEARTEGEGQAREGWTDGGRAREWIATQEKEEEGRKGEGLVAEGDEKSERKRGRAEKLGHSAIDAFG